MKKMDKELKEYFRKDEREISSDVSSKYKKGGTDNTVSPLKIFLIVVVLITISILISVI